VRKICKPIDSVHKSTGIHFELDCSDACAAAAAADTALLPGSKVSVPRNFRRRLDALQSFELEVVAFRDMVAVQQHTIEVVAFVETAS